MDYQTFLKSKEIRVQPVGKTVEREAIHPVLFDHQKDVTRWAILKGRAAIFADTGLGKTRMYLEWARLITPQGERALIVSPLGPVFQVVKEAAILGITVKAVQQQSEVGGRGIYVTNYESLHKFDSSQFAAVVLDESSILKAYDGKTRHLLTQMFKDTPYRLCATATPAPNDVIELGSHAEFLGVMTSQQMLSIFFKHDAGVFKGDTSGEHWRLKRHAKKDFYRWLASWAVALKKPSDLGYSDEGYNLPPLHTHVHTFNADYTPDGMLPGFHAGKVSATQAKKVRRENIEARVSMVADMVNADGKPWVVWCGLNDEAKALEAAIPGSVNVYGSMKPQVKADALRDFVEGKTRVLITKTSIAGFGINMQHSADAAFCGLDFSWEQYYQAVRRQWRFGQKSEVNVHVFISEQERSILETVLHKEKEATEMTQQLIEASREFIKEELAAAVGAKTEYREDRKSGKGWEMWLGDSAERMKDIPTGSVHLSVYSPPFSDMYVYNNTERDLSNSKDLAEFFEHYAFIIRENLRITMPGRICCVHVQDPKMFKNRHGYRGLSDFPGDVIRAYQKEGWIYRSRITIDKNPQIVASRNKDTDLLFVTGERDSTDLAPMATDYLLIFKAPGDNPVPVKPYASGQMTQEDWISWARAAWEGGIWYGIRETDVLNVDVARADSDEKHMCPLQLPVIERCIRLWSNPGELVFSAFGGVGSEPYTAIKLKRRALAIELKPEYFAVAVKNLERAEHDANQVDMFAWAEQQAAGD